MDEERLKQAARRAADILAQAKVTAARASQTLDRGKEARTGAAEALSRARRAEVWAEAAIGRIREIGRAPNRTGEDAGALDLPADDPERPRRLRHDQVWRAEALARQRAAHPDPAHPDPAHPDPGHDLAVGGDPPPDDTAARASEPTP